MVFQKLTKLKLNNFVHDRNKFVRNYNTSAKNPPKTSRFSKLQKIALVGVVGVGGYVYYNELMRETQIKDILEDNQNSVKEIIECFKGGYDVEELEGETFTERLSTTIKLIFRISYLYVRFLPVMIVYPFSLISERVSDFWYQLLVITFRACGPTFIKLGQWMATRPDLFEKKMCDAMEQLHSLGSKHTYEQTRETIKSALGKDIEEIFEEFDTEPIASGAIAQVYKAKLKKHENNLNRDDYVAVKIRHPGIEKTIAQDLKLIQNITAFIGSFESYKWLNLEKNVLTFAKSMKEQIDLRVEANNLSKFIQNFKGINIVSFPQPITKLCHPLVLVETWEEGIPIKNFFHHNQDQSNSKLRKKLASLGLVLYLKMLVDNFLHSDLHPGNIYVRLDKNNNPHLVVLDVGLVSRLKQRDRVNLMTLFTSIVNNKGFEAAECMIERTQKSNISKQSIEQFKSELGVFFNYLADRNTPEVEMEKCFQKALELGKKYHVAIDSTMATTLIGTIVIEGLGRQLNPKLDFIEESTPVLTLAKPLQKEYFYLRFNSFLSTSADSLKDEIEQKSQKLKDFMKVNDWF